MTTPTYLSILGALLCIAPSVLAQSPADVEVDPAPFQNNIRNLERQYGAMDHRLGEHFLGLGIAHRANGNLDEAVDALERALHINRVNMGLHHLMHVPIIDLLIESNVARGDWPAVEQQQRFRYWVHQREVDKNSEEFINAALKFAAWETNAYTLDVGIPPLRHLKDARRALSGARETIESRFGSDEPRLIDILHAEAAAAMNIAIYLSDASVDPASGGPTSGDDVSDAILRRNVILENFLHGKKALQRVVEITRRPDMNIEHALALANVADWELVFERPQSAGKNYRQAHQMLTQQGLPHEAIEQEFGTPRPVKGFTTARRDSPALAPIEPTVPFVTASFAVTKSGKTRNIEVIDKSDSATTRMIRHARARLRSTVFRPKISADGPVEAQSTIRYLYPDGTI